jgi:AraC-like DNA-binding protein
VADVPHTYVEWAPPREWRGTVACRWEQAVGAGRAHRVVPDGCADVIVGLDGGAVVVGLADRAEVHALPAGTWFRGLRFRPEAVASVLGVPGEALRNRTLPLDDVVGTARARSLVDAAVGGAPSPVLAAEPPDRLAAALRALASSSVDGAAVAVGLSGRQLRRLLLHEVGLGPKDFQRVTRLQRFLHHGGPLATAAVESGYADQPHLTREVARLCGLPPAALLAERSG